jgi:hypothetical protein
VTSRPAWASHTARHHDRIAEEAERDRLAEAEPELAMVDGQGGGSERSDAAVMSAGGGDE